MRKWAQRGLVTCPRSHSQLKVSKPVTLTLKPELCLPHKYEAGDVRVGRAAAAAQLIQAARGPVTLEKDVLGPDQRSPHTWPQAATSMAHAKHPQMSLVYLTPPVFLENQECCLK